MNTCEGCRYWSEMVAQSIGLGPMEALCLRDASPHGGTMTKETDTCSEWKEATHGAIDDPSHRVMPYDEDDYRPVTIKLNPVGPL